MVADSTHISNGTDTSSFVLYTCDIGHWFEIQQLEEDLIHCTNSGEWETPRADACVGENSVEGNLFQKKIV